MYILLTKFTKAESTSRMDLSLGKLTAGAEKWILFFVSQASH